METIRHSILPVDLQLCREKEALRNKLVLYKITRLFKHRI